MKRCPRCGKTKPLSEFRKRNRGHGEYQGYCRECENAYLLEWHHRNREKRLEWVRNGHMRRKYGLEPGDYERLLEEQGGGCAICGADKDGTRRLAVDHDPLTGKVRGLLCGNCNRAIGQLGHDVPRIRRAIAYLNRSVR